MIQNGKSEPASRILIVDDDLIDLQLLKSVLKEGGYAVELASGGELALKIARATLPDLIVLDVMMPGLDGYQVCERLKASERTRDIPVIFVTGRSEMQDKVMGFKSGAVDYITKPYQMEAVLAQVGSHLAVQAMQKQLAEQNRQLHREIVERQQAEEMLNLSEEKYRALVENINDVVFCLDTESRFTYVNPVIERFTQYRVDEVMRLPIDRFVHPDDLPGLEAEIQRTLAGAVGLHEFRLFTKNGAVLHVHTSSRALWEGDQLMGVTGIMTDITERKRAEDRAVQF
jgi:PAS domain S-box-containing protein